MKPCADQHLEEAFGLTRQSPSLIGQLSMVASF